MATKRCQVTFENGRWHVSFEGALRTRGRAFRTETEAYQAVTEWTGLQKAKGHEVKLVFENVPA